MPMPNVWKMLLPAMLSSCSTSSLQSSAQQLPSVQVDHVIVGVSNLEAGIRELEQMTGVRAATGGAHPGRGTQNALLSLGEGTYLELYAPNPAEKVDSATVTELQGLTRLTPIGWAVSTTDVERLRIYFGSLSLPLSPAEQGSRVRPDGSVLVWVTLGFEKLDHSFAPFFIKWQKQGLHPSKTSPSGCRLLSIRLRDPAPKELQAAVLPLRLSVAVDLASEKQMEVRLSCPRGNITLK